MWMKLSALEQSINLDSKTTGGIIGISQRPGALERWFLTCHERAAITTAMKEMCALEDSDRVGTHREAAPRRMLRDDDDVRKLLTVITSGLMTDPFSVNEDEDVAFDQYSHRCKDSVCSCRTLGQLLRERHCSDEHVCGTKTEYEQHKLLGFPPKSEDQDICFTGQEENSETG